jgi:hypothetical protein
MSSLVTADDRALRVDARTSIGLYILLSLLLTAPFVWSLYWPAANGLDVTGNPIGRDFINAWAGPKLAFEGRLPVLFDFRAYHAAIGELFGRPLPVYSWSYPPQTLPLLWPLAQLPYFAALVAWTLGMFALFAATVVAQLEPSRRWQGVLLLAVAPASVLNALAGQNGFLSGALLLAGMLWIDRRPIASGIVFGLLTFKPQLGIAVPFVLLALGAWRTIASAVLTAALLVGVSLALFGIEPWRQYAEVTSPYQMTFLQHFDGFYTLIMSSVFAGARIFGASFELAMSLQVAVAIPVLFVTVWAVRRTTDACKRAFVVACAAPLLSPYAHNYDLTPIAGVLVWILCGRLRLRPRAQLVYLAAGVVPAAMMIMSAHGIGVAPPILLALFVLSVREALGHEPSSTAAARPADGGLRSLAATG